jgi:hypothetical protein
VSAAEQQQGAPGQERQEAGVSSVKLTRNAKGDAQIEVKVYADFEDADLQQAKVAAQKVYDELASAYPVGGAK